MQQLRLRRFGHVEALLIAAYPRARAVHDLTAGGLAPLERGRDLRVADIEHIVQQEGGALFRRQPFEQRQESDGEVVGELEIALRSRCSGHDRLGQPGTDVEFALGLETPQPIDRQPGRRRDEPGFGVLDARAVGLMPAEIGFLDDIFESRACGTGPFSCI